MNTEAVSWVSERKSVLSMAWMLASLLVWVRWQAAIDGGERRRWW